MPLRRKIRSGYIITFVLLVVTYFFIFIAIWNSEREYDRVSNSYKAENKIGELKNSIVEVETSVRGYYITNDESFLKLYQDNLNKIPILYNELKELEAKNPQQLMLLDSVQNLIETRLNLMKKNMALFEAAGKKTTLEVDANRRRGQVILDSIRLFTQKFIYSEEKLMAERKNSLSSSFGASNIITIISLLVSIFAIFYSLYTYNRESKARDESSKKNIQYQKELENHIEELKRMDATLRELKSMEKFTATGRIARTIAHEVRNPLTNITLASEQLREAGKSEDSSMLLDMIIRNAVRINQLVSDLLNATKAMELNLQKVDINKILDDSIVMAKDRIDLNGAKVIKQYSKEPCIVVADETIIKIAFLNIIVNAVEAMEKDKGTLVLRTKKETDKCIIEIEDNGSGMDEDTVQKLFDPYFTKKQNGNGLGLTNCQNIVLSHKGKIEVKSQLGKGTVFSITLHLIA